MVNPLASVPGADPYSAYSFSFPSLDGKSTIRLRDFQGKSILIVNTASQCGFTPQYKALQAIADEYQDRGLVVLGVPSDDFGHQEPGTSDEIQEFCEVRFGVTFPLTAKQVVKGRKAHPFYVWAKHRQGWIGSPRWNFHKYLVNCNGHLVDWFFSSTKPDAPKVRKAIEASLAKK